MRHWFLTHWFQWMIDSLVVSTVWAPWILGHISFPKPSSLTPGILSIRLWAHLIPIHFQVGLLYSWHLEPKALDPESFFIYDLESFLFHLEQGALDSKSFFIYNLESFLFHLEPKALGLELILIYDWESFLFYLEPRALNLESIFIYDPKSFLFHLEPRALHPNSIFNYDPV